MKKVFYFVFVSFLLLTIASCGQNQANNNPILGYWEAETTMSLLGVPESDDEENQTIDMIYGFEFCKDGTGKNNIIVDEQYADHISNISFTYILDGDKLELTHEDGKNKHLQYHFRVKT